MTEYRRITEGTKFPDLEPDSEVINPLDDGLAVLLAKLWHLTQSSKVITWESNIRIPQDNFFSVTVGQSNPAVTMFYNSAFTYIQPTPGSKYVNIYNTTVIVERPNIISRPAIMQFVEPWTNIPNDTQFGLLSDRTNDYERFIIEVDQPGFTLNLWAANNWSDLETVYEVHVRAAGFSLNFITNPDTGEVWGTLPPALPVWDGTPYIIKYKFKGAGFSGIEVSDGFKALNYVGLEGEVVEGGGTPVGDGTGFTLEQVQDIVAAMFVGGANTNVTPLYDDAGGFIGLTVTASGGAEIDDATPSATTTYSGNKVEQLFMNFTDGLADVSMSGDYDDLIGVPIKKGLAPNSYVFGNNGNQVALTGTNSVVAGGSGHTEIDEDTWVFDNVRLLGDLVDENGNSLLTPVIESNYGTRFNDPIKFHSHLNDLQGFIARVSSGSTAHTSAVNKRGLVQLGTGSSATSNALIQRSGFSTGTGNLLLNANPILMTSTVSVPIISTAAEEFIAGFGLGLNAGMSTTGTNYVMLGTDRLAFNTDTWVIRVRNGSGQMTTLNTEVPVVAGYYPTLGLVASSAGVQFYIDGGAVGTTITANLPTAAMIPMLFIIKSAGTTARNFIIDYYEDEIY